MKFSHPDTKVVQQGFRDPKYMYIISQGNCNVSIYDIEETTGKMQDMKVRSLRHGDYFGEISVIYDSVRSATVRCSNYCTMGKIDLATLYQLCVNYQFFR